MSNLERATEAQEQMLSSRRSRLLAGYRLNRKRGAVAVRSMILADIRRFSELGAVGYASELIDVLNSFNAEFPVEAKLVVAM
jgi:hypothetical protein